MARRPRASHLENRTRRLALPIQKKPHHPTPVSPGISVAYRRCKGAGRWVVRVASGPGAYWTKAYAIADDYEPADGDRVLDWFGAIDKARKLARGRDDAGAGRPATVQEAVDAYAGDLRARGAEAQNASRVRLHLAGSLLTKPVSLLGAKELAHWRDGLIAEGMTPQTFNRTAKTFKAALNLAARHDPRITNNHAWRVGLRMLPDAALARHAVLDDADVRSVIAAAWTLEPALGLFVETLAIVGSRPSQVARCEVGDLQDDRDNPRLLVPSSRKGSRRRTDRVPIPVSRALADKLRDAADNRGQHARLFLKSNGTPWRARPCDHHKPFAEAATNAGLPGTTIYSLRHSWIARQLLAGTPVAVVAKTVDTSIKVIETNYARFIVSHADDVLRGSLFDPAAPPAAKVIPLPRKA